MNEETITEQQESPQEDIKGTPLFNEEDLVPYDGPTIDEGILKNEKGEELRSTENDVEDEPEGSEEPEEDSDDTEAVEEAEQPEPPQPQVEDPGEFVPNDYSFDVTIYDEDGKNGKTVKIKSPQEFDELLDKDSNFGNPAQLMKAQKLVTKMEIQHERDLREWQSKKEVFDKDKEATAEQELFIDSMAKEIDYLASKGDLPKVAKKYVNADWSDPEIAKQPGVKERQELLTYMSEENQRRAKAGITPMRSVLDAFNSFQIDNAKKQSVEAKSKAGQERKQAGARVASTSPNPVSSVPKNVAVGRVNALDDMGNSW